MGYKCSNAVLMPLAYPLFRHLAKKILLKSELIHATKWQICADSKNSNIQLHLEGPCLKHIKAGFKDSRIHFLPSPATTQIYDTSKAAVRFKSDLQKKATNKFPQVLLEGTFKSSMTQ